MDFELRLQQEDLRLKELLEVYLESSVNTNNVISQTTLTYLIIKTNNIFNDDEYKTILKLDSGQSHSLIFQEILRVIKSTAKLILETFDFDDLLELPLTNLKDISYQIALKFKDIFLVPIHGYVYDFNICPQIWGDSYSLENSASRIIKYVSKFNEMWVITSMLHREYLRLVQGRTVSEQTFDGSEVKVGG